MDYKGNSKSLNEIAEEIDINPTKRFIIKAFVGDDIVGVKTENGNVSIKCTSASRYKYNKIANMIFSITTKKTRIKILIVVIFILIQIIFDIWWIINKIF